MGTNYYFHDQEPCESCGRPFEALHIGKSSAGWCFALRVHPDKGINSLNDWKREFALCGDGVNPISTVKIIDEYGNRITPAEMLAEIVDRSTGGAWTHAALTENSAIAGPNGLARRKADGRHCIGHGDGTYDLLAGEFS